MMFGNMHSVINQEYFSVLSELDAVSGRYGTNSPKKYLSDYSPRIKEQILALVKLIQENDLQRLLSIGGWPGISGIVLRRITGVEVTLLDHPALLQQEFSEFYEHHGLTVLPFDLAESIRQPFPVNESFDLIDCCQCVEHWNFNPVPAFQNLFRQVLNSEGFLFLTVPNAVSLYRRIFTLFGFNPYPSVRSFVESAQGLPGAEVSPHWREYTQKDLLELIQYCGGEVVSCRMRHYKLLYHMSAAQRIHQLLHRLHPSLMSNIELIARPCCEDEKPQDKYYENS